MRSPCARPRFVAPLLSPALALALALLGVLPAGPARAGYDEGAATFRAGDLERAVSELDAALREQADHAPTLYLLGEALVRLGRAGEALPHLERAARLDPGAVPPRLALARARLAAGLFDLSVETLRGIDGTTLAGAERLSYLEALAVALHRAGQPALEAAEQWARAAPGSGDAHFLVGLVAAAADDPVRAAESFERAAKLDPASAPRRRAWGSALLRLARAAPERERKEAYRRARAALAPLAGPEAGYDDVILLGTAELGAGDHAAALASFERATPLAGDDWLVHFYTGLALVGLGRLEQAEAPLARAAERAPGEALGNVHRQLGVVLEKQRKWEPALAAYRAAGDEAAVKRVETLRAAQGEGERLARERADVERRHQDVQILDARPEQADSPGGTPQR